MYDDERMLVNDVAKLYSMVAKKLVDEFLSMTSVYQS